MIAEDNVAKDCFARDRVAKRRVAENLIVTCLAAALVLAPPDPASAEDLPKLAVLPIRLLDTSNEPSDQKADHRNRLVEMQSALVRDLAPAFRVVSFAEAELDAACPGDDGGCIAAFARDRGKADAALIAVVHKSSSLIMQLFVRIVDVAGNKVVTARELNFRGDTDESWRRAEAFLADQLLRAERP